MVRTVLADTAAKGLPGEHHFFHHLDTRAEACACRNCSVRAQHPIEMTIVLQHQFWDLTVTDQGFGVGLSFNGVIESLMIPRSADHRFGRSYRSVGLKVRGYWNSGKGWG